jgi:aryl-alcohol dehydrogenase
MEEKRGIDMKIKAAVVRQKSGPFLIEDVDLDEPREDEVLVRIAGTGLCHTDLAGRDGLLPTPLPMVFGHEGSGVVERVGAKVRKVRPGDHVVLSYVACGTCPSCRKGEETLCLNNFTCNFGGMRPDGSLTIKKDGEPVHGAFFGQSSFASHALAFERNTVRVPEDVPIEILGPLGCGVQTGAGGVINSLRPKPGSSLAVFGTGGVGMSAILAAVVSGCGTIIAVDVKEARLKAAREFGATHTINPLEVDPVEAIREITEGGVEYILDTTGIGRVIRQAVDALAVGGTCGLIGIASPDEEMHIGIGTMLQGRSIFGILEGDAIPDIFIPLMIELYRQGRFPFDRMITNYRLDQINEAATDAESGKALKAVLRP